MFDFSFSSSSKKYAKRRTLLRAVQKNQKKESQCGTYRGNLIQQISLWSWTDLSSSVIVFNFHIKIIFSVKQIWTFQLFQKPSEHLAHTELSDHYSELSHHSKFSYNSTFSEQSHYNCDSDYGGDNILSEPILTSFSTKHTILQLDQVLGLVTIRFRIIHKLWNFYEVGVWSII